MPLRACDVLLPEIERYRRAGVNVVSLNVGFGQSSWADHFQVLSFMRRWFSERSECRLIGTAEDVLRCVEDGKLGITFDIEGMVPVQDHPWLVQSFYELGVRWMLIAYNQNNKAGGGCLDEDRGLTDVGRQIIDEMERVGMVLCLSHAGERTVRDAMEYARTPPILSHSNPRGDHAHPRNVSDATIRACAEKGGVIGVSGIGLFLGAEATLVQRLLRQLRYVIDLVGVDHVGLGLDYVFDRAEIEHHIRARPDAFPLGLSGELAMVAPEEVPAIAEGLAKDNLNDDQIAAVMGGNWLRIARSVWK
jgi:membrane dipeptidase